MMAPATATTTPIVIPHRTLLQRVFCSSLPTRQSHEQVDLKLVHRRTLSLGLASAVLGLTAGDRAANAAGKRPPPPPPKEKKDPGLSGVQAKVLASKKRKEAMKQAVEQLREKGKPVN